MLLNNFVNSIKETIAFKERIPKEKVIVKGYYDKKAKYSVFVANNKYYYIV